MEDEIYALREQRQNVLAAEAEQDGRRRMEEMKALLEEQADIPLEYDAVSAEAGGKGHGL